MNETIKNTADSPVARVGRQRWVICVFKMLMFFLYFSVARVGRQRWVICALLFFAATVNYIDRQVIGILKPTLAAEFGWTEIDYGWIVFAFQTAYAIGLLFVGNLMDKIGTKKVFRFR